MVHKYCSLIGCECILCRGKIVLANIVHFGIPQWKNQHIVMPIDAIHTRKNSSVNDALLPPRIVVRRSAILSWTANCFETMRLLSTNVEDRFKIIYSTLFSLSLSLSRIQALFTSRYVYDVSSSYASPLLSSRFFSPILFVLFMSLFKLILMHVCMWSKRAIHISYFSPFPYQSYFVSHLYRPLDAH